MTFREVVSGIYRSPLPKARDIALFAARGGHAVVDLTSRPRPTIERACAKNGVRYVKHPMPYEHGDAFAAAKIIDALRVNGPVLFHCFHGRDRTGKVARVLRAMHSGTVYLYRVGRNLNRVVRTCEAFGLGRVNLVECGEPRAEATGQVSVTERDSLPTGDGVLALETCAGVPLTQIDMSEIHTIVISGETIELPRGLGYRHAAIPMGGAVSGLTVEGALAVALYEWTR